MECIEQALIIIIGCWGLLYLRAPLIIWTIVTALTIYALQIVGSIPNSWSTVVWGLFAIGAAILNIMPIRRLLITQSLFKIAKRVMPAMSQTEREAIEAGNVWWDGDLFRGSPVWQDWLDQPKAQLSHEEQDFLDNQVETLCEMLDDWDITFYERDLPAKAWKYLKKEGFFGLHIPKQYGGLGFSALASSTIVLKISTRCPTAAVTTMVPNSLGPAELLLEYGTSEQKEYYLPRLAQGKEVPCFALTAVDAGSDAASITDHGIVCKGKFEGKEVLGMRLTWDKRYITLAPVASVLGLAFKLRDPERLLGGEEDLGITCCLIPTEHPGVEVGNRHYPLHQPFMNGPTRGKDVFVPLEWIIGGPSMAGKGWRMLMECLSAGRGISLPALSTATGKLCFKTTGAYAKIRRQFGTAIGQFEGVQEAMARIGGNTYMLEAARLMTAGAVSRGEKPPVVSAIAKYHMTELARQAINDAMDVHGGKGIVMGPKNYLASAYMGTPVGITVEGANILTRNLIIFGQGSIRCHPYVQQEVAAIEKNDCAAFDEVVFKHLGYTFSNFARCLTNTGLCAWLCSSPTWGPLRRYYQQLGHVSQMLALVSDVSLLVLGGKLKRLERISARLGDVLSYLYLASCVLKYHHDYGDQADNVFVEWCLQTCLYRSQEAMLAALQNYPNRPVAWILKLATFPLGRRYSPPSDKLEQGIAQAMLTPSVFRDRLTQYCYIGEASSDSINGLESTLNKLINVESLLVKVNQAVKQGKIAKDIAQADKFSEAHSQGILTKAELSLLNDYEDARMDVVMVDEFSSEEL